MLRRSSPLFFPFLGITRALHKKGEKKGEKTETVPDFKPALVLASRGASLADTRASVCSIIGPPRPLFFFLSGRFLPGRAGRRPRVCLLRTAPYYSSQEQLRGTKGEVAHVFPENETLYTRKGRRLLRVTIKMIVRGCSVDIFMATMETRGDRDRRPFLMSLFRVIPGGPFKLEND